MKRAGAWGAAILAAGLWAGAAWGWEDYPGFLGAGHAGIVIGDFDGNGKLEAAVTGYTRGYGGSQLLAMLSADDEGRLGVRTISTLPVSLTGPLVPAPREGGADRLAAVAGEDEASQILILGGVPLRILRTIEAPLIQRVTAIADVDADGRLEVVAMTGAGYWSESYPVVLDYETGAVKWMGEQAVADIGIAQLDGDPALELILATKPGRIIDGATHAVEWTYPSGFGSTILVGRFGTDDKMGFATTSRWSGYVQVFQSLPYSPISEFDTGEVAVAATVRLEPGGRDRIAIGNGQWGDVAVYDPRSGAALLRIANPEHGVSALAVGDIDGDGRAELVYGAGLTSSGTDLLRAVDLGTLTDDYAQNDEIGPHSALARGDLEGGGGDQVAYLTFSSNSGYDGSNLYVLDAVTGKRLRSRANVLDSWGRELPRIAIAQLDGDAQHEIIVAGGYLYSGVVAVLDGVSLEDQWRVGGYGSVFDSATIRALATIDVNGDGTPDVVVATSAARVTVLDGRDGALLWQSVTLNGSTPPSLMTFRSADGSPHVAVARGAALYVFNLASHLLTASTKTAAGVVGLWQWGDAAGCRLAALDEAAVLTVHRCDTLTVEARHLLPVGSVFFRPLDANGHRFMAASGSYLYEVAPDGTVTPMAGPLGNALGAENQGVVRALPGGQHFDVTIGSDYLVTRVRVGLDAMFANGFD